MVSVLRAGKSDGRIAPFPLPTTTSQRHRVTRTSVVFLSSRFSLSCFLFLFTLRPPSFTESVEYIHAKADLQHAWSAFTGGRYTDAETFIKEDASREQVMALEKNVKEFGIRYWGMDDARQGIVHVIGPEQGDQLERALSAACTFERVSLREGALRRTSRGCARVWLPLLVPIEQEMVRGARCARGEVHGARCEAGSVRAALRS